MKTKQLLVFSFLLIIALVACQPLTTSQNGSAALLAVPQQEGDPLPTITDRIAQAENLTTLYAAVEAAELVDALAVTEELTVFAPTDEAFAALPAGVIDALLADPELLTAVLLYHVVEGVATAEDVVELESVTALNEQEIAIGATGDGVFLNATVAVIETDLLASNGVVHFIDGVLLPEGVDLADLTDAEEVVDEEATDEEVSDEDVPDEEEESLFINEEEGGLVRFTGVATYTNPFFTEGTVQPMVILEDQTGFVNRDRNYIFPIESQVLGQLTSDFRESPFTYSMVLPIEPAGGYSDVDNDGVEETGIQVFAPAYWDNVFGGPFLEERDVAGGGWSGNMVSTILSSEPGFEAEIIGGKLIVYAPDDQQSFPINFGEDGKLFTDDDQEMIDLPQGYTVVNLDTVPFTFDRSREQRLDLLEASGAQQRDYSDLGYADAFDAMVDDFIERYAFTDYKEVDWEELREEYKPIFEEAEERGDNFAYRRALRDFINEVPDGHLNGGMLPEDFRAQLGGELGLGVVETTDGRILIDYVEVGGPGEAEGIQLAAEVISLNEEPILEAIDASKTILGPFSREQDFRLAQLRNVLRFPPDTEVTLTYINPDSDEEETATMIAVPGFTSFLEDYAYGDIDGFEMPVEYDILPNGMAYATITSFLDNRLLQIQLWERLMANMRDNGVDTLVLDMRVNGGGFGYIADYMASYLFDEAIIVGNTSEYDELTGEYVIRPENAEKLILPEPELRFLGEVVVLIGPGCASACEFFSYNMTLRPNTTIIGQYGTPGLGGGRTEMLMPDGETVSITVSRQVDADGDIHVEGLGVNPDVFLPVSEESILYQGDFVLDQAIEYLNTPRPEPEDEEATDEDATDEEATDEEATDEDVTDEDATDEEATDEEATDEEATDEDATDEEATGEDATDEDATDEEVATFDPELTGELAVDDNATDTLAADESHIYRVKVSAGSVIDITADADNQRELDLKIAVYNEDGVLLFENDDRTNKTVNAGLSGLEIGENAVLFVEVSGVDDSAGDYTVAVTSAE